LANPGASDASGPVFTAAGDPFSVTVTAVDSEGDATPNYGREAIAESVLLTPVLRSPSAGNNPPLAFTAGFGAFAAGQASGNDFSWPEVGVIQLTPSVADADYLGTGDVMGNNSGDVGRFVPHHFATTVNAPVLDTYCDSGGFSYVGQAFNYLLSPVISLTAQAAGNTTTLNYTASYWKLSNASIVNRNYTATTGTVDTSGLPPATTDPVIADLGAGTGTLTFSSGSGLAFQRTTAVAVFDADIRLGIDVIDTDAVAAVSNPVSFGDPGGIAFDNGRSMRYGRVAFESALGSERVDLAVPMRLQYYLDDATGFVSHVADDCSNAITLSFSGHAGNLDAGETCVMDTGSPGNSAAGCVAPAPIAKQYRVPPSGGNFNLFLQAPGAGNDGSVSVNATVPDWLKYDWNMATPGDENPAGQVTFGIYRGDDQTIYQREVY
ncbi:MAG: hypothetical protein KJO35_01460, partial [Gammaproteobacteria bacterium]|nr:hypothetical protein [Gammaproteobacteria bacterium]